MKNIPLMMSLKARGLSVTKLARAINSSAAQVSLTLNNTPERGHLTRPKLAKLLTSPELALVGWDWEGKQLAPGGNKFHVEHVSTGQNNGNERIK